MSQLTTVSFRHFHHAISTLTSLPVPQRVRLYGADCNQSALVVRLPAGLNCVRLWLMACERA